MNIKIEERYKHLSEPDTMGSYSKDDCVFLLKNINDLMEEQSNEEREKLNQSGVHYSEMLPIEYEPKEEYIEFFHKILDTEKEKLAELIAILCQKIVAKRGKNTVFVSLARAGTPIGVLMKRYMKFKYNLDIPHYSISIIRGKGFDENALCYILHNHPDSFIQFIDGWTGKGAITKVLESACTDFNNKYDTNLEPDLAVLSDPANCVSLCATKDDFLIPSACLNSTISGLLTRTVERKDLIGEYDYHGAKYYDHWKEKDISNYYIETISNLYTDKDFDFEIETTPNFSGWSDTENIMKAFGINDINLVKPSVGECTRVLLRRVPWKILIDDFDNPNLKHILMLAKDRNVPVEIYKNMSYSCVGIIKSMRGE